MNPKLTESQADALLELLRVALMLARDATWTRDLERAEAITDAVHNLPRLLRSDAPIDWSFEEFDRLFLQPLYERYPDLGPMLEVSLQRQEHFPTAPG